MARHINQAGLDEIKRWEGLRLNAYQDSVGVWTIGYGHTAQAGVPAPAAGMRISAGEAESILRRDLEKFEAAVERRVTTPLNDNQFAALVSFVFNVGDGNFAKSTLLRKLNGGNYEAVPAELAKWNKAGGHTLPGLANRRAAEAGLWSRGSFVASQSVDAEAKKVNPMITPEAVAAGSGVAAAGLTAATNPGPLQWAMAIAVLVAVAVAAFYFIRRIKEQNA